MPDEPSDGFNPSKNDQPIQDVTPKPPTEQPSRSFSSSMGAEVEPATNTSGFESRYDNAQSASASAAMDSALREPVDVSPAPVPKKSKKKMIIVSIIIVLIGLLIAGAAAVYALWYQNPEKMMADAFIKMVSAKTSVVSATGNIKSETSDMKVIYSAKTNENQAGGNVSLEITPKGQYAFMGTMKFSADGAYDQNGTIYFKVNNVKTVAEQFVKAYVKELAKNNSKVTPAQIAQQESETMKYINPVVNEIDGRWMKVTSDYMKKSSKEGKDVLKCTMDATKKLRNDKAMSDEVYKAYKASNFVVIKNKLGNKDGNVGYEVSVDKNKVEAFSKSLKDTAYGKELIACDKDTFRDETNSSRTKDDSKDQPTGKVELWIGQWSHTLNRVVVTASSKDNKTDANLDMTMKYNDTVNIEVPKDARSVEEVSKKIESMMSDMSGGTNTPASSSSTPSALSLPSQRI